MISGEDIDAFTPEDHDAFQTLNEVEKRMTKGVPQFMEASALEFPKIVRAGLLWRDMAVYYFELHRAAQEAAIGVFDRNGNRSS